MVVSDEQVMAAVNEFCALMEDEAGEFHAMRAALEAVFSVDAWEHRTGERTLDDGTEERRPVLVGPWVRCDEQPDFVDELEAELAARRPVPVQQDEPEGTCRLCAGEGWFGWEGVKVPGQRLLAQRKAHCKLCDGTGVERPVPVQQDEPEDYPGSFVRGDFALCWNTGNLEVHDGKSHTALCEADAQALSRWLIAVLPVQQDEPEACDHVWRSSFGDTFCEKCNQDFASDGEGSSADPGSPPARQTAAGSQPSPVPVQQDEPEGVCAFPNCSCTENRCPAKGERGPFCDHGFHPRLCGRCAPVPEAVTDEDEVQCQMCKTVQPRPDKECGHCGAGPKYLCPIHTRPAAVPVQQERSVRAPKTDDPHSLPRVDDLLDDIPVQQEPGR